MTFQPQFTWTRRWRGPFPVTAPSPIPIGTINSQGLVWDGVTWRVPVGIPEAPQDGQIYGRQDQTWQLCVSAINGEVDNLTVDGSLSTQDLNVTDTATIANLNVTNFVIQNNQLVINGSESITNGSLVVYNPGNGGAIEAHDSGQGGNFCLQVYSELTGFLVGFWYGGGVNPDVPVAIQPGNIITNGDGTQVIYNTTSDANLKERERDVPPDQVGRIIDNITPKYFRWKARRRGNDDEHLGLMAQDVYPFFPDAVTPGRDDKPWMIDYSKLVPLLLAELKALRQRVAELETS